MLLERIFGSKRTETPVPASFESRLRDLEELVEKTARQQKAMSLEWEEVYDKVMHLMARITKRAKTADRENGRSSPPDDLQEPNAPQVEVPAVGTVGTHSRLAEMRRRNGLLPR